MATYADSNVRPDDIERLVDKLSDPATAEYALGIVENLEALYVLTVSLNEFLKRGDVIVSSLSEGVGELRSATAETGKSYSITLEELFELFRSLGDKSAALGALLRNQLLEEHFISGVSVLTKSLAQAHQKTKTLKTQTKGLGSLIRSIRDPDVQRGLDFAIELLRSLGRNNVEQ